MNAGSVISIPALNALVFHRGKELVILLPVLVSLSRCDPLTFPDFCTSWRMIEVGCVLKRISMIPRLSCGIG